MAEDRKGFWTAEQEKKIKQLLNLKGIYGVLVGPAISIADNKGMEALKKKIVEKYSGNAAEILQTIYEVNDAIFDMIPDIVAELNSEDEEEEEEEEEPED